MVFPNFEIEESFCSQYKIIAGVDEVGRGALAGPIVAAAVVFSDYQKLKSCLSEVTDSKKLTEKKRVSLSALIKEMATDFGIGEVSANEIDKIGIGAANVLAFKRAIGSLKNCDFALIDGRKFRGFEIKYLCLEKGELKSISIAAASIIAKVYRDNIMKKYSEEFSGYFFEKNVGYGSPKHSLAIKSNGITPLHRKSFLRRTELDNQAKLF